MIRIENLHKSYGATPVLSGIALGIDRGEIFGIVGHSGAGKSTLLRCLNGLESYQSGSLRVMGDEVRDMNETALKNLRRNMGMIFQNFSLMARKSVFENVVFPLEIWDVPKAERKERTLALLELVGLADRRNDRIQSLSGGQKQRVGIARALALNPKILLCDEATSALDPKTTITILDLLQRINERFGLTIVLVTHQMEVVKRVCHRLLLLYGGVTQCLGRTEELFLSSTENL
jgi:D-methionine transport system ATP-binding protein